LKIWILEFFRILNLTVQNWKLNFKSFKILFLQLFILNSCTFKFYFLSTFQNYHFSFHTFSKFVVMLWVFISTIISLWRCNTRHNYTQHNDNQHNDTQHNDIQHNEITFSIMAEHCYAECNLCWVSRVSPLSFVSLCWMSFCCVSLFWVSWRPLLQSQWIKGGKFAYIFNTLFPSDTYDGQFFA
jgi:hypothetical protein